MFQDLRAVGDRQQGIRHSELPTVLQVVGTEENSLEEAGEEKDVNVRCRLVWVGSLSQDWTVSKSDVEVDFRQVERYISMRNKHDLVGQGCTRASLRLPQLKYK